MPEAATGASAAAILEEPVLRMKVVEKTTLSAEIVAITLGSASGDDLPAWEPGAHIDLVLDNGVTRQYSLCGSLADQTSYRIGVLKDPNSRGGSTYVHEALHVGDTVEVRGPRNHFVLKPSKSYVFAAGGIGVTPLIPMASEAAASGADFTIVYCGRSRESMGYIDELRDRFGDHLVVNADDESGLFDLDGYFRDPRPDTMIYACGPAPFLNATIAAADAWPSGTVHVERFEPIEVDESSNVAFEVQLASSGVILPVPADQSILQVLTDHDVRVLSSCTEGTCGTCEVGVLAGGENIDHRDAVLSPEEWDSGEMMMVCVSRCRRGRLLLDL